MSEKNISEVKILHSDIEINVVSRGEGMGWDGFFLLMTFEKTGIRMEGALGAKYEPGSLTR